MEQPTHHSSNSFSNNSAMDQSQSSQSLEENALPFFADMTLDLAEAHDIAETPEPMQRTLISATERVTGQPESQYIGNNDFPSLPILSEHNHINVNDPPLMTPPRISMPPVSRTPTSSSTEVQESPQYHNPQDDTATSSSSFVDRNMDRVTVDDVNPMFLRRLGMGRRQQGQRRRRRQWPKDVSWSIAFVIVVPVTMFFPIWFSGNGTKDVWIATAASPRLALMHTILWGLAVAILLSRLLYHTAGGGDGDDARHLASQILLVSAPLSVSVFIMLVVAIKVMTPRAFFPYALIPLWYLARDLYLFRRWKMTATTPGGRQAFFQALTCMTLDILSRSLRRSALWRMIVGVIVTQFLVISLWRVSLLSAIQSQSPLWILMAAMGGKWATGTVARLLSLVACGGIANWFAEQSTLVEEVNQMQQKKDQQRKNEYDSNDDDQEMIEFTDIAPGSSSNNNSSNGNHSQDDMPEAYSNVDASAYKSVLQVEGMEDDDYEDEYPQEENINVVGRPQGQNAFQHQHGPRHSRTTVKQFMLAGLSVSFGSVAKCGLLGGVAQFLWSQIRKIDHARATFGRGGRMQGMDIGGEPDDLSSSRNATVEGFVKKIVLQINVMARDFVRSNSDMAMSYVAEYQVSYSRAAQDVALLVDEAGVEPIIHDDISTHMSACVGGSVSGLIVLFTGAILTHQRNRNSPSIPDSAILLEMLMAFYFCYTLIFTVMEPLRASIKAVYVCFAQHPESLSQSFPLIFHRLSRMSQSNLQ